MPNQTTDTLQLFECNALSATGAPPKEEEEYDLEEELEAATVTSMGC